MKTNQEFTLYCKGKQEDINRFKAWVASTMDSGMNGENETSITFVREGRRDMCVYADFLPLMAEFTGESGAPLSFFFAIKYIKRNEKDVRYGYAVFQGGNREYEFYAPWIIHEDFEGAPEEAFDDELTGTLYAMALDVFSKIMYYEPGAKVGYFCTALAVSQAKALRNVHF
jgi:hypothetical protein